LSFIGKTSLRLVFKTGSTKWRGCQRRMALD
jgi:hypothetical protein